jgi:hypothetical protein
MVTTPGAHAVGGEPSWKMLNCQAWFAERKVVVWVLRVTPPASMKATLTRDVGVVSVTPTQPKPQSSRSK